MYSDDLFIPTIALFLIIIWELAAPLINKKESFLRLGTNITLAAINLFCARYLVWLLVLYLPFYAQQQSDTPAALLSLGFIVEAIAIILLLDFLHYWSHWLFHQVPLLWRLHKVHHSDLELDFSSSQRHHPFEALVSILIFAPFFMVANIDLRILGAYFILHQTVSLVVHANIKLPARLERIASKVFVTPLFHRQHHSQERRRTDSHYGQVFSFWDRWFGTYIAYTEESSKSMKIGLTQYTDPRSTLLDKTLTMPFTEHKPDINMK